MAGPFVYSALPPGSIRLLKMLDAGISSSKVAPRFQLLTTRIEVAKYIAVSYVWGGQAATESIFIDGQRFNVRQNLYMALSNLRKCTEGYTIIWVDAICINQADNVERNAQVKMMDRIFGSARHVIAWLGAPQIPRLFVWREQDAETVETDDWVAVDHGLELSQRSYWTRMWIVQELSLAQEIHFMVGDKLIDLFTLQSAIEDEPAVTELGAVLPHLKARGPDYVHSPRPLYDLILEYKDCKSTDRRDKVFALLSLVPNEERKVLENIFPDYTLSYDAVVVLTLSFIRNWQFERRSEADLEAVLDALEVSKIRAVRRRILAVSETVNVVQDPNIVKSTSWVDVPYEGWAQMPMEDPPINHGNGWARMPMENPPINHRNNTALPSICSRITAFLSSLCSSPDKTDSERFLDEYQRLLDQMNRRAVHLPL